MKVAEWRRLRMKARLHNEQCSGCMSAPIWAVYEDGAGLCKECFYYLLQFFKQEPSCINPFGCEDGKGYDARRVDDSKDENASQASNV